MQSATSVAHARCELYVIDLESEAGKLAQQGLMVRQERLAIAADPARRRAAGFACLPQILTAAAGLTSNRATAARAELP